jgi:hypothetical protein
MPRHARNARSVRPAQPWGRAPAGQRAAARRSGGCVAVLLMCSLTQLLICPMMPLMRNHKVSGAAVQRARPTAQAPGSKVPITERALIQRINRKLATDDKRLLVSKPSSRWLDTTGRHYMVDVATNSNVDYHVDVEALGRELKVLKDWEELGADS